MVYKDNQSLDALKTSYAEAEGKDILKTTPIKIAGTDAVEYEIGGSANGFHIIGTNGKIAVTADDYPMR